MRKLFVSGIIISFAIIALFVLFVVVPSVSSKTISKRYTVDNIYVAGVKDLVFENQEESLLLYINRGLEDYSLDYFESRLLHQPAIFTFSFNESYKVNRIKEIECNGEVIYQLHQP